jgi:hypothetical protein
MDAGSLLAAMADARACRSMWGWASNPTLAASLAKARLAWLGLTAVPRQPRRPIYLCHRLSPLQPTTGRGDRRPPSASGPRSPCDGLAGRVLTSRYPPGGVRCGLRACLARGLVKPARSSAGSERVTQSSAAWAWPSAATSASSRLDPVGRATCTASSTRSTGPGRAPDTWGTGSAGQLQQQLGPVWFQAGPDLGVANLGPSAERQRLFQQRSCRLDVGRGRALIAVEQAGVSDPSRACTACSSSRMPLPDQASASIRSPSSRAR